MSDTRATSEPPLPPEGPLPSPKHGGRARQGEREDAGASARTIDRRRLISMLGGGAVAAALPVTHGCAGDDRGGISHELADPIYYSSVVALAEAIRSRRVSSIEVVDACLARIEGVNPALNAVFQIRADAARAEAREADAAVARGEFRGPLHGVPMTIKDSLDTAGVVTTGGTAGRAAFVPEKDATVVQRVKDAGAILLGKTNTSEFTAYFETYNLVYGRTNNPWDLERTPGGSSGGAAALVAAGGTPFDIGSDFGGSVRLPAHYCGVAGIKPTMGRVPRTGHILPYGGVQDIFQQLGPIARTVDDLDLILRLIAGPDFIDPAVVPMPMPRVEEIDVASLRVAFHVDNGVATPTAETGEIVRAAADALAVAGARVEEAVPPAQQELFDVGQELWAQDGSAGSRRRLERWGTEEHTLGDLDSEGISSEELDLLQERWFELRSRMLQFMQGHDVILCPANAGPAVLHGGVKGNIPLFSYTEVFNITGWPAAVVPAGMSADGLPIGAQVAAAPASDATVLAAARVIEAALGGFASPPL